MSMKSHIFTRSSSVLCQQFFWNPLRRKGVRAFFSRTNCKSHPKRSNSYKVQCFGGKIFSTLFQRYHTSSLYGRTNYLHEYMERSWTEISCSCRDVQELENQDIVAEDLEAARADQVRHPTRGSLVTVLIFAQSDWNLFAGQCCSPGGPAFWRWAHSAVCVHAGCRSQRSHAFTAHREGVGQATQSCHAVWPWNITIVQHNTQPSQDPGFLLQVGWPKRPANKLETALQGSYLVSSVVRRELDSNGMTSTEQLIGLIRCTSDRVFNATIWDVLVDPEYQVHHLLYQTALHSYSAHQQARLFSSTVSAV